jgi:hypothetical protein
MCGELDEFGNEVVEKIDALNGDIELGRAILRDLLQSIENGLG